MLEEAPGLQHMRVEKAELLGAPIDSSIQEKVDMLRCMVDRLCLLQTQDALLLLQQFSISLIYCI